METSSFRTMRCVPCEGGVAPMEQAEIDSALQALGTGWSSDGRSIERNYRFADFKAALAFVNRVGDLAETHGHHPDISLHSWNRVRISLSTHAIQGLSSNDFILAAHIEDLEPVPALS